jgi:CSLREA domain-containing protein
MPQLGSRRVISGSKFSKSGRSAGSTPAYPEKRVENARRLFAAAVEALEPRQLLSTYTVTDLSDSATDTGSLRYAINAANGGGATTITFDPSLAGKTIILTSGQLELGSNANVTITGANAGGITISGNNASRVFQIDSGATAEIDNLTLANGNSNGDGGAIDNSGTLTLNADTITNSSGFNATFGGGAGGGILSTGTLNVTNSTIYGNTGGGQGGGGIAIYSGNATLTNDTITDNSDLGGGGAQGGGVGAFGGSVTLVNTIVAGNKADGGGPDVSGSFTSLGHNLIGNTTRSSGWISTDLTGTAASPLNPLLATQLGNYGGPTQTLPLLPGSPALGGGAPVNGITTDQRGVTRSATAPSIGAFESAGFNLNYSSGDNQSPLLGSSFAPLVVTVTPVEAGDPVGGGVVQFTVNPVAGAGATLANASATINTNGTASTAVTANAVAGSYTVTAASVGVTGIATFHLTNSGGNIVVNTTADSTTTAPGVLSLREAIAYANAISTPSTITFAPGLAGQTIRLTSGQFSINQNITIDASSVGGVTLNGNGANRFFNVNSTLSLNDLTLTNGAGNDYGGAIQNYGNLNISNCVLSNDDANYFGGAIQNSGNLNINNCVFSNDSAVDGGAICTQSQSNLSITVANSTFDNDSSTGTFTGDGGGAIYTVGGGFTASISLSLINSTFSGDTAARSGGAIYNDLYAQLNPVYSTKDQLTLTNCTLTGDTAGLNGGAIYSPGGGDSLTLNGTTVSHDMATNDGGAIYTNAITNEYGKQVTLNDSTLSDDMAGNDGGAIFNTTGYSNTDSWILNDSTLSGDTAGKDGGAIYSGTNGFGYGSTVSVTLNDTTLAGNTAVNGGGIFSSAIASRNQNLNASVTATDCTLSGNSASSSGGGIYTAGSGNSTLTLTNSILANSPHGGDYYSAGGTISGSNNLVDDGTDGLPDTIKANPLLGTLGNYGGPTQTIPLLPGSPAIGAGVAVSGITTDQRGVLRPATPDIGAYQYNLVVNTTADNVNDDNVSGPTVTLREAINYVNAYGAPEEITFAPSLTGETITLDGSDLELKATANPVTIDASSIGGITISGNTNSRIFQVDSWATVYLTDLTITNGNATNGGGIYNNGTLTVTDSTLSNDSDNSAFGGGGGGIYNDNGGELTITNSTFANDTDNVYSQGGGGAIYNGHDMTITNCTFTNDSTLDQGGAICNVGDLTITNSTFNNNQEAYLGGGIYNSGGLTIKNSTFSNNSEATNGGGICNVGALTITNSTFSNDSADAIGGGIYNSGGLTITNSTFTNDSSHFGGGIFNEGGLTITSSTFYGADIFSENAPAPTAYNSIFTGSISGGLTGSNNLLSTAGLPASVGTVEPSLAAFGLDTLGNYGGPTQTIPLLPGSPAIGAGVAINGVTTDQRGVPRPATPDIGAYQYDYSLVVNSTADNVNDDNVSGPTVTLREAVNFANTFGGAADITFAPALAGQTITLDGSQLELTATANAVTIDASSIGGITISGNTASRVFQVDSGATVYLTDLTITNGSASIGGGILTSGMLTVTDSTFTSDSSTQNLDGGGGGIYNYNGGEVTITNSTFTNDAGNTDFGGGGGGIYNGHYMTVTNSTFTNDSTGWYGGGICNVGDLTVTNSTFNNDLAFNGGGIYNSGGLTVTNSTFSNNSGAYQGGGIFNDVHATATINSSTFSNDSAEDGGGIYNFGGLTVTNSTFSNDSADNAGGGILNDGGGTLTITNSTFTNDSSVGGGIFNFGSLTITSSTFYGNSGYGSDIYSSSGTPTAYNSIFTGTISGGLSGSNNLLSTAGLPASVGTVEPTLAAFGLGTLGNYGGPTQTIPLLPGSPAIGAGVPIAGVTTDQTGYTRSATAPSIGAYENEGFTINATGGGGQTTVPLTPFAIALRVNVRSNNPLLTNLAGGVITFTAPATGASATFGNNPITLSASGTGSTLATANGTPGNYSVTATASGITNAATFSLKNQQITPTVTVNPIEFTYGTKLSNGQITGTATYLVNAVPTTVPGNFTFTYDAGKLLDAGKYPSEAVTFTPKDTTDFATVNTSVPVTVDQASAIINISGFTGVYDGNAHGATGTAVGVLGENLNSLLSVGSKFTNVPGGTASWSFAGNTDYKPASGTAPIVITQATPTITVTDNTGVFNGLPYTATSTVTSGNTTGLGPVVYSYFYASDTSFQHQLPGAPTNVGNYLVIAVYNGNSTYNAVGVAAYFNITPAKPTVTITANGGTYTGLAIGATATVTGLNNIAASSLESVAPTLLYYTGSTASGTGSSTAPINAGTYTAVATFPGSADYSTASASKTFSITQAASNVTVTGKSGTYNGSPFNASGAVSGVALSTTPTFTYSGTGSTVYAATSTAPTNAGSYSVTATYLGDTNHTGNTATATFTIGQATPSISVTDTGGVYNTLPYAATGTTTGVNGTSLGSPTYRYYLSSDTSFSNPTTTAPTNVGSYVLIALSPVNSNYMQVGVAVYFSITQASSVLTPVATTVAYGGSTTLSTTLKTTGGALLAGRTVTFSVNGKVIGTAVTNSSGVASLGDSVAGITPGVYASGIAVSFAGDANSTATSATASLTVLDAPIVSSVSVSNLLNIASVSGSFTQARSGAAAGDFVATVNWGDGNTQTLLVVADLLHPGQFDLIGLSHLYLQLNQKFTVTVTISTVGKFGAVAGTTASYVTTIVA